MMHDMPIDEARTSRSAVFVARRARGEPVAYLLGEREFHGHLFRVGSSRAVPRPETEFLVDAGIEAIDRATAERGTGARCSVLDLCTGSGCVAACW
jgi:release factor glutamine methyltransferase